MMHIIKITDFITAIATEIEFRHFTLVKLNLEENDGHFFRA